MTSAVASDKPVAAKPFAMFPNPDYGTGCYRRRVRLQHLGAQTVLAEMEDDQHGFRITVQHDGHAITQIHSESLRIPMTTCGGAGDVLAQLVGVPLSDSPRSLAAHANPRAHCTHQYDLLGLAITHARRNAVSQPAILRALLCVWVTGVEAIMAGGHKPFSGFDLQSGQRGECGVS